jgi:CubicO group peptidase (beta-lactamase class C family)
LDLKSTVSKLAKIPLLHHPGTKFHYSASTDVLGRVVEVVSHQELDEYFQANIFEPLGMKDTCFSVPTEKQDRFAQLYKPGDDGKLKPANPLSSVRFFDQSNRFFSGGGGLCSTIDDYLAFSQMLLNDGQGNGKQIVQADTLKQMFANQLIQIDQPPGRQFKFGLGFRIFPQGDYGWGGAAGTRFWVNPEKDLAIIFMTQIMPYGRRNLGESFRDAVYASLR